MFVGVGVLCALVFVPGAVGAVGLDFCAKRKGAYMQRTRINGRRFMRRICTLAGEVPIQKHKSLAPSREPENGRMGGHGEWGTRRVRNSQCPCLSILSYSLMGRIAGSPLRGAEMVALVPRLPPLLAGIPSGWRSMPIPPPSLLPRLRIHASPRPRVPAPRPIHRFRPTSPAFR